MTERTGWWTWNAAKAPVARKAHQKAAWMLERSGAVGGDNSVATPGNIAVDS